ncbi:MAG: sporulation protein YqfC [Clostridiaceae bacterium]
MGVKWDKAKDKVLQELELPRDVMLDLPKVTIIGIDEICIENHKGIVCFESTCVKVNTKIGIVLIRGESFQISFIGGQSLVIQGKVKTITYEGKM